MASHEKPYQCCLAAAEDLSLEDYRGAYWPKLEKMVAVILSRPNSPEGCSISYEEMYTTVYKCVCHHYSELLYENLIECIRGYLIEVSSAIRPDALEESLLVLSNFFSQYNQSISSIVAVFQYMNRYYVSQRYQKDLKDLLLELMMKNIIEQPHITALLHTAISTDLCVKPDILMAVTQNLQKLDPDFQSHFPGLYARFVPSTQPTSKPWKLDEYQREEKAMQQILIESGEFSQLENPRKREAEENIELVPNPRRTDQPLSKSQDGGLVLRLAENPGGDDEEEMITETA